MSWGRKYGLLAMVSLVPCCLLAQSGHIETSTENSNQQAEKPLVVAVDSSQADSVFIVRRIIITGNNKTKPQIILREIPFHEGEQYPLHDLVKKFEDARRQLMNTTLFTEVVVALHDFEGTNADILIDVRERWYLFPVPYFKPVDGFDKWINEYHFRPDRINYGIKLMYKNPTGINDNLNIKLMNGYTKQISFSYDRLYIDAKMKWGMALRFDLGKNHEVNYNTINDKQVHLKDNDRYIRSFSRSNFELTYRRAIKTRHRFGIAYTEEKVHDTIITLNPTYFTSGRSRIYYPEIYYSMSYYDVDYIPYPLKGYIGDFSFVKVGLNNIINLWQITAKGSGSWPITNNTHFNLRAVAIVKLPFKQPYFNKRLLGSNDLYMQGYEYYVIDGVAGGYVKATFVRELFHFNINLNSQRYTAISSIPFRFFGKIYGNTGYIHDPQPGENLLSNKMLYSGGIGLDILTLYDMTLKLEWSFNPLGQNGLYLHQKSYF